MPVRLLRLLQSVPQSGDELAARLGIGRVRLHGLAHALQEQGFPVLVSRRGYALEAGTPAPHLLDLKGRAYRYLGTTSSTQDELKHWATDPVSAAPAGAVVLAERQNAGRGRRGRVWETGGHNLTFSLLLPPGLELSTLSLLPLAAGVALCQVTQTLAGVGGLKWPNDLLSPAGADGNRRKLAGLLLEADLRGEEVARAVLGVGLNVQSAPPGAAHLSEFRPEIRRDTLLLGVLDAFDYWLTAPAGAVLDAWRALSVTLGQRVEVQTGSGPLRGLAHDIGPDGALLVQDDQGTLHRIGAGDVQLIGRLSQATPSHQTPTSDSASKETV
ncbi:biotin--[acetyl-CoA-carboxylase] ligase [Deinococcus sp. KNUC1210]|uniref:biotin--[acetyl-CoA-carboxylase] ligase n=1 Tax=Deinococcus sp. KNUC1210 TaxID=2917691 RepID=UPI001EEFC38A|nr:biotin--[acetyl-CoA-carboxylase] ligase [Deinococcus sp. KNUC1210]ULH14744.1 biotin--[acetyl-CoA-carboxylase] ligase [Deinococcus sp. KNUC1210]